MPQKFHFAWLVASLITELNNILSVVVSRVSSKLSPPRKGTFLTPPWKKRLQVKVANLRKDLGRLEELRHREPENRTRNELMGRYNIKERGWNTIIEEVRQRLIATSAKIKRFTDSVKG